MIDCWVVIPVLEIGRDMITGKVRSISDTFRHFFFILDPLFPIVHHTYHALPFSVLCRRFFPSAIGATVATRRTIGTYDRVLVAPPYRFANLLYLLTFSPLFFFFFSISYYRSNEIVHAIFGNVFDVSLFVFINCIPCLAFTTYSEY